jgi:hypothetical protein
VALVFSAFRTPFNISVQASPDGSDKGRASDLDPIFRALSSSILFGALSAMFRVRGISLSTLSRWKIHLAVNQTWGPSRANYDSSSSVLSEEQEKELPSHILGCNIDQGLDDSHQDFKFDALNFQKKAVVELEEKVLRREFREANFSIVRKFACPDRFIKDFRHRDRLVP